MFSAAPDFALPIGRPAMNSASALLHVIQGRRLLLHDSVASAS